MYTTTLLLAIAINILALFSTLSSGCVCPPEGSQCGRYTGVCHTKMNAAEQKLIVDFHNEKRSKLAKGNEMGKHGVKLKSATNMEKMYYSEKLANEAYNHVNMCNYAHTCKVDRCKAKGNFPGVGENLGWSWVSPPRDTNAIDNGINGWYKEVENVTQDILRSYRKSTNKDEVWGHYTQMIWSNSNEIGCAVVYYQKNPNSRESIFVCYYNKPGNYRNSPAYEEGSTCSNCPSGTKCERNSGLCASNSKPQNRGSNRGGSYSGSNGGGSNSCSIVGGSNSGSNGRSPNPGFSGGAYSMSSEKSSNSTHKIETIKIVNDTHTIKTIEIDNGTHIVIEKTTNGVKTTKISPK